MPAMLRTSKKAQKIAESILGKASNWQEKLTEAQREVKRRLIALESRIQK